MHILLVDADASAANILAVGLRKTLPGEHRIENHTDVPDATVCQRSDIAIINHNLHDDSFSKCFLLKQRNPALNTIVITSPGDALRHFLNLRQSTGMIDEVVEKPVHFTHLARSLETFMKMRPASRQAIAMHNLDRYLPSSLSVEELQAARSGDAILTECTVLFADIRRSTQLLHSSSLDDFFGRLNRHFATLADIVQNNRGEIIKYTGDGVLALFTGFARRYLGFRCAREILQSRQRFDPEFSMGLGLSDGLVMLGFIGSEQRMFYDVIGSNVNMAARFCAEAAANELLMSESVMQASGLNAAGTDRRRLAVKGIEGAVTCYQYRNPENPA